MAELLDPEVVVDWDDYFEQQAVQSGHGAGFFQGQMYQRGHGLGNIFRGIFKFLLPLAKSAATSVGKEALHTGVNIVTDSLQGKDIKEAAIRRGREAATHLVDKVQKRLSQSGKGRSGNKQSGKGIKRRASTLRKLRTIGIPKRLKKFNDLFDDDSRSE